MNEKEVRNKAERALSRGIRFPQGGVKCPESSPAMVAVQAILADLTDRRGLRQEWDSIDKNLQKELVEVWVACVNLPGF